MRSGLAAGRHCAIKDYDLRWRFPHKTYLIFPTELARIMIIVSVLDSLHLGPWGSESMDTAIAVLTPPKNIFSSSSRIYIGLGD